MKIKTLTSAIAIGLISSISTVSFADISLLDYDEATSAYQDAYLTGEFDFSKSRSDAQSAYKLDLGLDYNRIISNSSQDITLHADTNGTVKRDGTVGAERTDNYIATLSATADNYFQPDTNGSFWYGSASIKADDSFEDLQTKLSIGLGYGRVKNLTPMAKAIRLISALRTQGIVKSIPSKESYNRVAQIIAKESQYKSKYGYREKFYARHWISAIEKELGNSPLGAAGVLSARSILIDERISTRKSGWKARAGLAYVGTDFSGIKNNPGVELGMEYHHPINNRTQFSNELTMLTTFDDNQAYTLSNALNLTHEVDDRIDWENKWTLNYNHPEINDVITTNTLSSALIYELGNALDLTLTATIKNSAGNDTVSPGEVEDGTDRSLNIGVRYRLK
ncbi:MAG: DUF481 domain-containing protein [Thiotrichaceae bacterium]|nr:DUF481 domain-containing protein [Thiotrichaceae bacterium]